MIAAGAVGLVGVAIAATLAFARPDALDRCGLGALDRAYNPRLAALVGASLDHAAHDQIRARVTARLSATADAWRATQQATCHAEREVAQDPTVAACLEARRLELAGFVEDAIAGGAPRAPKLERLADSIGDPAACATPAPGLLFARVPADPALRRRVTALRERVLDAEAARDRDAFPSALAILQPVLEPAAAWPPLLAEVRYVLGTIQSQGGETKLAVTTLRDAATLAERVHHDRIAANSWISLTLALQYDHGDAARSLEYAQYAEAAIDRLGRPPAQLAMLEYARGATLVDADRAAEAEVALRKAVELMRASDPSHLALAIQGLGYLYEDQGRYRDAVEAYRAALARGEHTPGEAIFHVRLAINLALLGEYAEAEDHARRAVDIVDRTVLEGHIDRPLTHGNLAQVLQLAGRSREALAELQPQLAALVRVVGDRDERYGELSELEGSILTELGREAEAEPVIARACEVIAFTSGDTSSGYAECEIEHALALAGLGRHAAALAALDHAVDVLSRVHGATHPEVGATLAARGHAHAALGHRDRAIADFERAIAVLSNVALEPGHLASARWGLGRALEASDAARARGEVEAALALFDAASLSWAKRKAAARAWLVQRAKPPQDRPVRKI